MAVVSGDTRPPPRLHEVPTTSEALKSMIRGNRRSFLLIGSPSPRAVTPPIRMNMRMNRLHTRARSPRRLRQFIPIRLSRSCVCRRTVDVLTLPCSRLTVTWVYYCPVILRRRVASIYCQASTEICTPRFEMIEDREHSPRSSVVALNFAEREMSAGTLARVDKLATARDVRFVHVDVLLPLCVNRVLKDLHLIADVAELRGHVVSQGGISSGWSARWGRCCRVMNSRC